MNCPDSFWVTGRFCGTAVAVLLAAVLAAPAVAQEGSPDERMSPAEEPSPVATAPSGNFSTPYGSHLDPILRRINATPKQRKQITIIVRTYKPKIEPLRQRYREKQEEFLESLQSNASGEHLMLCQGEMNNLYNSIVNQYSLMRIQIRRLLTPQQVLQMEEYRRQQNWR